MFGPVKRKDPPLKKAVARVFGDDAFFMEHKKKNQDFIIIAITALGFAYRDIRKWDSDSKTKGLVKHTNHDVLAFEIALFTVYQALSALEHDTLDASEYNEFEDDELDKHDCDAAKTCDCIRHAMYFMKALVERTYGKVDTYFFDRVKRYSGASKDACMAFSFNLTCIHGAQNFDQTIKKVRLDLKAYLHMIPFAIAHRKVIVPAFIDSVNRLLAMEAE